jgi:broad specificity phosphatase PhoE
MKPANLYIVRHGESEGNVKKVYGRTPEVKLTETGKDQARKRAEEFAHINFAAAFSSDLVHARQTAEIILHEKNLTIGLKEALRERSYGRLDGKTREEMQDELKDLFTAYEKMSYKDRYYHKLVEDMESVDEAVSRFILILREIATAYNGENVLIVSHVTMMRGLLIHLGFANYDQLASHDIENTAVIKLESDGISFTVKETIGVYKKTDQP